MCLLVLGISSVAEEVRSAPDSTTPSSTQYLPDSTVLARVGDRAITAEEFVERYFNSYPENRPASDSAGRAEFLQSMVDKEVLALIARRAKRPEDFQDRAIMRAHTQRVLGNVLYQRAVLDSVTLRREDIEHALAQVRQLRLERVRFRSGRDAEEGRSRLASGRLERSSKTRGYVDSRDLGWRSRTQFETKTAQEVFALPMGGISPVLPDSSFFSIYRVLEERPPSRSVRDGVIDQLRNTEAVERSDRLAARLRSEIRLTLDTVNVNWVANRFPKQIGGTPGEVVINVSVPKVPPADTSRVLATSTVGQVTVGRLIDEYRSTSDLQRPSLDSPDAVRRQMDVILLEPYFERTARERGLDRDPIAVALIERRREELMVEHLYQDSIMTKIFISPSERRKYYKDKQHLFVTAPNAEFATFAPDTPKEADSLVARLRSGERAVDILRADSLGGRLRGSIKHLNQDEKGKPYYKVVFEDLRPGEIAILGTQQTQLNVVQLISLDSGREVSFEEADPQIDEYLTNQAAEAALASFLKRHKRRIKIEAHPEWVMQVRFVDPMGS